MLPKANAGIPTSPGPLWGMKRQGFLRVTILVKDSNQQTKRSIFAQLAR
jgi:hypothetical protein